MPVYPQIKLIPTAIIAKHKNFANNEIRKSDKISGANSSIKNNIKKLIYDKPNKENIE